MESNKRQRVDVKPAVEKVAPVRKARRKTPAHPRQATFCVSRKLSICRSQFLKLFDFKRSTTLTDSELCDRAAMMKSTMMDYGDIYEFVEFWAYQNKFHPQWPALYERFIAHKDDKEGTEWAVFDKPGRVEFVRRGGAEVTESLPFPNKYALGPSPANPFKAKQNEDEKQNE